MFITLNANFITVHLSNFLVSCQSLRGKFVRVFSLNCSVDHQCNPTNSAHCTSWGLPDLPETIKKSLTFNDIDNIQDFPEPFLNIFLGFPNQKITVFWDSYLSLTTLLVFHWWQLFFSSYSFITYYIHNFCLMLTIPLNDSSISSPYLCISNGLWVS